MSVNMQNLLNTDNSHALAPDLREAESFLRALDETATGWTFQTFDDDDDRKDGRLARVLHGTLEEHAHELRRLQEHGAGVFVTINETDGRGRGRENIVKVRAAYLDLDGAPLDPVRAWLEPQIVTATSPGRWHVFWLLRGCPLDRFKGLQQTLIRAFDGDASVHDLPRVMRLPGFFHQKRCAAKGLDGAPRMVRTIETGAFPVPFSLAEFERKLATLPAPPPPPRGLAAKAMPIGPRIDTGAPVIAAGNRTAGADEVAEILSYIAPDADYHTWVAVLMGLHDHFAGSQEGLALADNWSAGGTKYRANEVAAKWGSFKPGGGTGLGSVCALARQHGADLGAIARRHGGGAAASSSGAQVGQAQDRQVDGRGINDADAQDLSHDALALGLERAGWGRDARFVASWGKWAFWDGTRWRLDDRLEAMTRTREYLRHRADGLVTWAERQPEPKERDRLTAWAKDQARTLKNAATVAAVERLAQSNAALAARAADFDKDRMLLGTPGGTVDLRTGRLGAAMRAHMLTRQTTVTPAPGVPVRWLQFLGEIFGHDAELIAFIQRAAGYALTGETREHKLLFLYGTGRNGKSVLLNTIFAIMGDYARRASAATFLNSSGDKHPTDLAGLQGARLVVGSELPKGKTWDESVIKDLTGGDVMTARFMRGDFFDFEPQLTLVIAGNTQPSFRGVDEAIRARVVLVPFNVTIPAEHRDPHLVDKLKAEAPQILQWAIEGALQWQARGLDVPASVAAASVDYFDSEDTTGQFLADETVAMPGHFVAADDLHLRFRQWCDAQGLAAWTQLTLIKEIGARGFDRAKSNGRRGLKGLRLK